MLLYVLQKRSTRTSKKLGSRGKKMVSRYSISELIHAPCAAKKIGQAYAIENHLKYFIKYIYVMRDPILLFQVLTLILTFHWIKLCEKYSICENAWYRIFQNSTCLWKKISGHLLLQKAVLKGALERIKHEFEDSLNLSPWNF